MVDQLRSEYLICYDIQDNKIRKKVSTLLLDLGLRDIQKSVYWGFLSGAETKAILREAKRLVQDMDKLLITPIKMQNREKRYIGHGDHEFKGWDVHGCI